MGGAPRCRAPASSVACHTTDRYGDIIISCSTRAGVPAGTGRVGAGSWWPDFGPTTQDFSYLYKSHPTDTVFENVVAPFTANQRAMNQAQGLVRSSSEADVPQQFRHPGAPDFCLQQFRRPQPEREALYSSQVMPCKKGGRRKVGDDNHWKSCVGRGRYPMFAKSCDSLKIDDSDRLHQHPLNRGNEPNIHASCTSQSLAAGGATGTNPCEALERSISAPALDPSKSTLLSPAVGSTLKTLPNMVGGPSDRQSYHRSIQRANLGSSKLPNWIAQRTVASRDKDAAGHAGCLLKKLPFELQ